VKPTIAKPRVADNKKMQNVLHSIKNRERESSSSHGLWSGKTTKFIKFIKKHHKNDKTITWTDLVSCYYGKETLEWLEQEIVSKADNPSLKIFGFCWLVQFMSKNEMQKMRLNFAVESKEVERNHRKCRPGDDGSRSNTATQNSWQWNVGGYVKTVLNCIILFFWKK
jgi:hypothetical protein